MKIVFAGTPAFAVPALKAVIHSRHEVCLVVTQPDRPSGRGRKRVSPPVKQLAQSNRIPVIQPESINRKVARVRIEAKAPDAAVVVAYGKRLTPSVLHIPPLGCLNIHASLLPKYRGAAPVAHALLNGETETGITIQRMDAEIDAGPIVAQRTVQIYEHETAGDLEERLALVAAEMIVPTLDDLEDGIVHERPQQNAPALRAPKLRKSDGLLRWDRPAAAICSFIRAMTPWPGAFTFLHPASGRRPHRLMIAAARTVEEQKLVPAQQDVAHHAPGEIVQAKEKLIVATGLGMLSVLRVKPEGRKPMDAAAYLCGHPFGPGDRFHDHT